MPAVDRREPRLAPVGDHRVRVGGFRVGVAQRFAVPAERGRRPDAAQQPGHGPYPQVRLHADQRPQRRVALIGIVGLVGDPGARQQRDEPGERSRGQVRPGRQRRAPAVGTPARQQFEDLAGGRRLVTDDLQHGRGQDVAAQLLPEMAGVDVVVAEHSQRDPSHRGRVPARVCDGREFRRVGHGQTVVELPDDLAGTPAGLPDQRLLLEGHPEDLAGDLADTRSPGGAAALPQGRRCRHRADRAERTAGLGLAGRRGQTPQQHRDVGALSAVIGVELVQDDVGEVGAIPQRQIVGALQQQVEHLVVGDEDVRRGAAHLRPLGHHPGVADLGNITDVQAGGHIGEPGLLQITVDAQRLVGGQGVHRVQQQRLDPDTARPPRPLTMVEDGNQERLGLARAGTGGHHRRAGRAVQRTQPLERLGLMLVRGEVRRHPLQMAAPAVGRRPERRTDPQVGAAKDAMLGMVEERRERLTFARVGERERGGQILGEVRPQALGGKRRSHGVHPASFAACNRALNTAWAWRISASRSAW